MKLRKLIACCFIAIFTLSGSATAQSSSELTAPTIDAVDPYNDLTDEEIIDDLLGLAQCSKKHLPLCITGSCSGGKVCLPKINITNPKRNTCSCQPLPKIGGLEEGS